MSDQRPFSSLWERLWSMALSALGLAIVAVLVLGIMAWNRFRWR